MKAALAALSFMLLGMAGLVSAMWFLDAFLSDGKTTAFIPFDWGVQYTTQGSVLNLTYAALILSFVVAVVSSFAFGWLTRRESGPCR